MREKKEFYYDVEQCLEKYTFNNSEYQRISKELESYLKKYCNGDYYVYKKTKAEIRNEKINSILS